jgi:hypothetical protein
MKTIVVLATLAVLVGGCDRFGRSRSGRRPAQTEGGQERLAEAGASESKSAGEVRDLAASVKAVCADKRRRFEEFVKSKRQELAPVCADLESLSKQVAAAMEKKSASGKDVQYEHKLLEAMKDKTVNELAVKYLGGDFSSVREDFIKQVRDTSSAEERYRKALAEADAAHSDVAVARKKLEGQTRDQQKAEISRLRKEISDLEKRWAAVHKDVNNLTKHSMVGDARAKQERRDRQEVLDNRLRDIQDEILRKRKQVDVLTSPGNAVAIEQRAMKETQWLQRSADNNHEMRLMDIERRMKPKRFLSDVLPEFESKTIGKLRAAIVAKKDALEAEIAKCDGKIREIESIETSLPLAEARELQEFRKKLLGL